MPKLKKYFVIINSLLVAFFGIAIMYFMLFLANGQYNTTAFVTMMLVLCGATIFTVNWLLTYIANSVGRLKMVASALKNGECIYPTNLAQYDFLADIAAELNTIQYRIHRRSEKLDLATQKLATILGSMTEGIIAVDQKQMLLHLNQAAIDMLAIHHTEFIGKPLWEVTRSKELNKLFNDSLNQGTSITVKVEHISPSRRWLQLKSAPLKHEGQVIGAVIVLSDVTNMHKLDTMRKDFITNASHELKTPVTAIIGLIETILDDSTMAMDTQKRFLQKINMQSKRINTIVGQLLALSKAEGVIETSYQDKIVLGDLCVSLTDQYTPVADLKGISFSIQCSVPELTFYGNQERLLQAIGNIVNNAVKYTANKGKVHIVYQLQQRQVIIAVSDTGIGIAKHEQSSIFERFYRIDKAHNSQTEGSGLGLAIARHIIIAHGGSITLESELGQGSTFYITLPLD